MVSWSLGGIIGAGLATAVAATLAGALRHRKRAHSPTVGGGLVAAIRPPDHERGLYGCPRSSWPASMPRRSGSLQRYFSRRYLVAVVYRHGRPPRRPSTTSALPVKAWMAGPSPAMTLKNAEDTRGRHGGRP